MGKQFILIPQNTAYEPLLFSANWGGSKFKNPFNTGTIAKIRNNNLQINKKYAIELLEVGEDGVLL
ncbi:MAG: hypothetical protein AB8U25_06990 [Rickettsiales endosymbiont of Dermacentor nuttalli]